MTWSRVKIHHDLCNLSSGLHYRLAKKPRKQRLSLPWRMRVCEYTAPFISFNVIPVVSSVLVAVISHFLP